MTEGVISVRPPKINLILSFFSIVCSIIYVAVIPIINEDVYSLFALILCLIQLLLSIIGLLYFQNRKILITSNRLIYISPLGKQTYFSPYVTKVTLVKPFWRYTGGMVIRVERLKLRIPENYRNYSSLQLVMKYKAAEIKEKTGIM